MDIIHSPDCTVWVWIGGEKHRGAKKCSCGASARASQEHSAALSRLRPLRPLGMSDHDFLRTLRIDPEDTCE